MLPSLWQDRENIESSVKVKARAHRSKEELSRGLDVQMGSFLDVASGQVTADKIIQKGKHSVAWVTYRPNDNSARTPLEFCGSHLRTSAARDYVSVCRCDRGLLSPCAR